MATSVPLQQEIKVLPFEEARPLHALLGLRSPLFLDRGGVPFAQLQYIETYLEEMKCRTVVREKHYIDRDHMEDHAVFYSRSLYPYENYCTRLHFFRTEPDETSSRLRAALSAGLRSSRQDYRESCRKLSDESYLGFTVIRPLDGSPVGRTVLRPFDLPTKGGATRTFHSALDYHAHLLGVDLTVEGLAFQQQDVGVSACATTALWSSLNKVRDLEEIRAATPAQITMLAARHSLRFGRPMPQEGLSLDQMCQAIHSFGVSADLLRLPDTGAALSYIYSATVSETAPILVLARDQYRHAVTVVGVRTLDQYDPALCVKDFYEESNDLTALYLHDDRVGPYVRAGISRDDPLNLTLKIGWKTSTGRQVEDWRVTHILIPVHSKIRLSFANLRRIALTSVLKNVLARRDTERDLGRIALSDPNIRLRAWIARSDRYGRSFHGNGDAALPQLERLWRTVPMARYLAVVRVRGTFMNDVDVLFDTTSTLRNAHALAVLSTQSDRPATLAIAKHLADTFRCELIS